jgi:CheY-like chemotaxis protein
MGVALCATTAVQASATTLMTNPAETMRRTRRPTLMLSTISSSLVKVQSNSRGPQCPRTDARIRDPAENHSIEGDLAGAIAALGAPGRVPPWPTHLGLARPFGGGQGGCVSATGPATILVLEENAAVQELIDQALREAGHSVLATKNSLEAIEIVRRVRVDVLVAGELFDEQRQEIVDELRSIQPGLGVVSTVGPDDDLQESDVTARLSPPFSLDDLRAAVATILDH